MWADFPPFELEVSRVMGSARPFRRMTAVGVLGAMALGVATFGTIQADEAAAPSDAACTFQAQPFEFDPTQSGIVVGRWVQHLGLADTCGAGVNANSNFGLLLSKNGPTATNASAGAEIRPVAGITVTELGFDIRHTDPSFGSHCGAGAPRFNVVTSDGTTHF